MSSTTCLPLRRRMAAPASSSVIAPASTRSFIAAMRRARSLVPEAPGTTPEAPEGGAPGQQQIKTVSDVRAAKKPRLESCVCTRTHIKKSHLGVVRSRAGEVQEGRCRGGRARAPHQRCQPLLAAPARAATANTRCCFHTHAAAPMQGCSTHIDASVSHSKFQQTKTADTNKRVYARDGFLRTLKSSRRQRAPRHVSHAEHRGNA